MPRTQGHYSACILAALAAVALSANIVAASPFDDTAIAGTVFTGPTHPHPSAVFVNPAALDLARPGSHFFLGGYLSLDRITVDRQTITDPASGLAPGPSVKSLLPSPGGMFAFYQKLEQLSIGFTMALPTVERFPENDALRYHVRSGRFMQIAPASLAVAVHPFDRVHIGVGFSLMLTEMQLTFARDTALAGGTAGVNETTCAGAACGIENAEASQTIAVDVGTKGLKPFSVFNAFDFVSLSNATLNIGMVVRVRDGWFAGLSYRSAPDCLVVLPSRCFAEQVLPGTVTVTDSARDGGAVHHGQAEVSMRTRQSVLAGVRGGPVLDRFDLVVNVEYHSLSRHDALDIRLFGDELAGHDVPEQITRFRGFKDVWRLETGLESRSTDNFRYGGRVRFETAAVDNSRITPLQVHGTNLGIALGSELRFGGGWSIGGSYVLNWYPGVDASDSVFDPRDRLTCVDSEFDLNSCNALRDGRAIPTAAGKYGRILQGFTTWIRYDTL